MITILRRLLPRKVSKHYVRPFTITGERKHYDARRFFESWYATAVQKEFSDGITISGEYNPLYSRYHYNSVENGILEYLAQYPVPFITAVLDVGPGAGHWIDFYRDVVRASEIVGVEIAPTAVRALRDKYDGVREVVIKEGDVSEVGFSLDKEFDIVNAIGVMFHITDDPKWQAAVGNLARHLRRYLQKVCKQSGGVPSL